MTQDEQEASSFRYVAPRIMVLSSGNIAVISMLGREPPRIYTPAEFGIHCLPTMDQLDETQRAGNQLMRERMDHPPRPKPIKASLDDLA